MAERTCLRCGAPYDEGATVCFTCGASIGELETPTQPVRAPKLPAAPEPAIAAPAPPVATAIPTPRVQTVGARALPPVAPPNRWPLVVGVVVGVLIVLVGGGLLLRSFLTPATPTPSTSVYHDPQGRYSFTQPTLWTVTPRSDGSLIADSDGTNTATITIATAQNGQSVKQIADTLATQQGLGSAPSVTIGGEKWEERTGRVTGADGATRSQTLYVDVHNGDLYTIVTSSPTSVASSINTLVYQPLLASFTFHG